MPRIEDQIMHAIQGRRPLIYLHTPEEAHVAELLAPLAGRCFPGGSLATWSCVTGLNPAPQGLDTRDPVAALRHIIASPGRGFYVMKDLSAHMQDPQVVRALREAYFTLTRDFRAAIIVISPVAVAPEYLEKELFYIELGLPGAEELAARLDAVLKRFPGASLAPELRSKVELALRGLTLGEADHVLQRAFSAGAAGGKLLEEIFSEKQMISRKAGYLEYVPVSLDTSAVGGLDNVKAWAEKRRELFSQEAVNAGLPVPKGVLVMGVSGCGKSLLAKAIAGTWKVPLFRLNMNLIFSGLYGSPEAAFHKALRTAESLAPIVLWIDEMESSLSTPKEAATPMAMNFAAFLTWMQEKPPLVFVAATANRIEMLPAEIIRKGRFDQVFFCDLPNEEERLEIMKIHLAANQADPAKFDLTQLLRITDGWSGAEIQQAIIGARIETRREGREMTTQDIWLQAHNMVPLSKTMAEQVNAIRDWAFKRATPASSKRYFKS